MVLKVTGRGADGSGQHRRPRLMLRPRNVNEIPAILSRAKSYPTPVRAVGADYSQTRCVGSDGGTALDTGALDKVLELGSDTVRVQAGVRLSALVKFLAGHRLELELTPEIGNISVGAVAVATLPQPSYAAGLAQMSSCVTEMKLITPQGRQMTVAERERGLMRVLRSSFGLLGIVHEAVLRVRPLTPVKIDYQSLPLKEFCARYVNILGAPGALRLHVEPFNDRITVERREVDEEATVTRSGIWRVRSSVMRNVLPAFGASVGSVLAAPGLRHAVLSGMHRALRATHGRGTRGVAMFAHEWMRELPQPAWKARHTYNLWAFPERDFPRVLGDYFAFSRAYYKQNRYRCNVETGASRLHQDRGSLFSASYEGGAFTLEPSSAGENGWDDFVDAFNEFAATRGGTPTFNQTQALRPEYVAKAFGERAKLFRALRNRTDPLNRLRNGYFAQLLG
jgi:FAD/FMN-containing dehydrogenase